MNSVRGYLLSLRDRYGKSARIASAFAVGLLALVVMGFALSFVTPPSDRLFVSRTGYTIRYPAHWIEGGPRRDSSYESEFIREPENRATIAISSHNEPRLRELIGRVAVAKEIELSFIQDKRYRIDFFSWLAPDTASQFNAYIASGSFINDDAFLFREVGILDPVGEKITFRSEVRKRFSDELVPVVDSALLSVRTGANKRVIEPEEPRILSAEEAKALVEQLPDYVLYRRAALERGVTYTLETDDGGSFWYIRLFDVSEAIRIPLQRWRVDKATGAISKVLL